MTEEGATPAKKKRQQPNKKWTEREVLLIIDFLHEEPDFEVPTAQFFYKRFLQKTQLDVSWVLVRWKVRHLKEQFKKANEFLASTGAGLLAEADGRTIQAKIAKTCPYYDRLKEIFGKRVANIEPVLVTTDEFISCSPQLSPASPAPVNEIVDVEVSDNFEPSNAAPSAVPVSSSPRIIASRIPKSSISQLAAVQNQKISMEKKRLEFEKEKFKKNTELEERRLDIEAKKLELEDKWKKLDLEMRERVAMFEIEKKYSYKKYKK